MIIFSREDLQKIERLIVDPRLESSISPSNLFSNRISSEDTAQPLRLSIRIGACAEYFAASKHLICGGLRIKHKKRLFNFSWNVNLLLGT